MDKDVYIINGILLSHKMNEITPFVTTWLYPNHTKPKTERQISWHHLDVESKIWHKWTTKQK